MMQRKFPTIGNEKEEQIFFNSLYRAIKTRLQAIQPTKFCKVIGCYDPPHKAYRRTDGLVNIPDNTYCTKHAHQCASGLIYEDVPLKNSERIIRFFHFLKNYVKKHVKDLEHPTEEEKDYFWENVTKLFSGEYQNGSMMTAPRPGYQKTRPVDFRLNKLSTIKLLMRRLPRFMFHCPIVAIENTPNQIIVTTTLNFETFFGGKKGYFNELGSFMSKEEIDTTLEEVYKYGKKIAVKLII